VKHCFSTDDAAEALNRLRGEMKAFKTLTSAHESFAKLDKKLAQDWFDFTRSVEKCSLSETLEAEKKYYKIK
jgi:hypothetical protein